MKNSDMPAMPAGITGKRRINQNDPGSDFETMSYSEPIHRGLTKREHFAAMAMQGLLASRESSVLFQANRTDDEQATIAKMAIRHADNLLAELDRTK